MTEETSPLLLSFFYHLQKYHTQFACKTRMDSFKTNMLFGVNAVHTATVGMENCFYFGAM